ncbi:apolipoprotein N-acyltransferase [Blattabacterium cuenoti]|uniref:apolipoprotein N-acyltransferase n=1 Tax=Blattabacterium cuenoti TaxID=1653831 RepID=UPI001EEA0062|nr:apolipoprotein N-acyltransferase [Blattabacterium cuenoti]
MDAGSNPANSIYNRIKIKKTQYFLYSVFSGFLLSIGWPTDGNPIYLFVAFVPLLYIEEYFSKKNFFYIFFLSFISFLIWNSISTWWLSYAKRSDGSFALEAYIIPIMINSTIMSFIFTIYSLFKKYVKIPKIGYIFLICFWILFEKMHLEWELSWPWLNLGNGFSNRIEWIQWYEYTGTLGGTIWIWIVNIGIINSIIEYKKNNNLIFLYKNILVNIFIVLLMIAISNIVYFNCKKIKYNKPIETLILQPNIDPYNQKYKLSNKEIIIKFKKLMNKELLKKFKLIVAPETSFHSNEDKILTNNLKENKIISNFIDYFNIKSPNTIFIVGLELLTIYKHKYKSNTSTPFFNKNHNNLWCDVFNSVVQIKSKEKNILYHHKYKLVPAVESFPYKKILYPIIGNILLDFGGNIIELGRKENYFIFNNPNSKINIAPIICYESIFGEYVSKFFKKNANIMVIITNDGWWGNSQGYKQHLYYSRLRAIENRKYIARSANTGVSCFIDDKGNIISKISYGKEGILTHKIYSNSKKTFYTKHGDFLYQICFLIIINIILYTCMYKIFFKKFFL